jgi:hypothetical protein
MGFNAVQPFGIDSDIQLSRKVLIAALTLMRCMQIAPPNRTTFQLPAKWVGPNSRVTH